MGLGSWLSGFLAYNGGALFLSKQMISGTSVLVDISEVNVSIHVPTLNEEHWLPDTLDSLINQEMFKNNDIKLVVIDNYSDDNTVAVAQQYTEHVLLAPRGKLNARHAGILYDGEADIIVAVDSGDIYPPGWLTRILQPFTDSEVVCAHGPIISQDLLMRSTLTWFNLLVTNQRIRGGNSAFRTSAYQQIGGFNLDINQFSRAEVRMEEEIRFHEKMRSVGKVVFVFKAGIYVSFRGAYLPFRNGRVIMYQKEKMQGLRF